LEKKEKEAVPGAITENAQTGVGGEKKSHLFFCKDGQLPPHARGGRKGGLQRGAMKKKAGLTGCLTKTAKEKKKPILKQGSQFSSGQGDSYFY